MSATSTPESKLLEEFEQFKFTTQAMCKFVEERCKSVTDPKYYGRKAEITRCRGDLVKLQKQCTRLRQCLLDYEKTIPIDPRKITVKKGGTQQQPQPVPIVQPIPIIHHVPIINEPKIEVKKSKKMNVLPPLVEPERSVLDSYSMPTDLNLSSDVNISNKKVIIQENTNPHDNWKQYMIKTYGDWHPGMGISKEQFYKDLDEIM